MAHRLPRHLGPVVCFPSAFSGLNLLTIFPFARDSYRKYGSKNIWGKLQIRVLDTTFWQKLSVDPEQYHSRVRAKIDLVSCDFAVMPIFGA